MSQTNELQVIDPIETSLVKQSEIGDMLIKLPTYKEMVVNGIDDKLGYKAADEARKEIKKVRVLTSKIAECGRQEAVRIQKAWIAKEKEINSQFEEVEAHLQAETDKVDAEKERIRQEAERVAQERLNARCKELIDCGCAFDGSNYSINELTISMPIIKDMDNERFSAFMVQVKEQYAIILKAEADRKEAERIEAERIATEKKAEEERLQKEREELERQRREFEEQQAKSKAEQERIAAEQKAAQDKIDAENKRIADERAAAERSEAERIAAIAREKELEEARVKAVEDERLRMIEEQKAEEARKMQEAEAAKIEATRQAALAPDKEKLMVLFKSISELTIPECATEEGMKVSTGVQGLLTKVQDYILKNVKSL